MTILEQAIERYANNINKPLLCAGFYLETAIKERIYLGYTIVSVKLTEELGNKELNTYEIIHK